MTITTGVGLISGIDFESYIDQISEISRRPITIIQSQMSTKSGQADALSQISSVLTALYDQLEAMLEPEDFEFRQATSADDTVVTIDAEDTAPEGSYNILVRQLAQAHRIGSQGVESNDTTIATTSGEVKIQIGDGAVRTYDVDSDTTLTALRDMINQDTQSSVTASILNDGSDTNAYRLVLTSDKTGEENEIVILQNDTTLDFANTTIEAATADDGNQFDGTVAASGTYTGTGSQRIVVRMIEAGSVDGDARFEVSTDGGVTFSGDYAATSTALEVSDGVEISFGAGTEDFAVGDTFSIDVFDPTISEAQDAIVAIDGITVSRSSNVFDDVVDGITFTAVSVSDTAVTTTVNFQEGLLQAKVTAFQDAYNNALSLLEEAAAYDSESQTASVLFGDSTVRTLENVLRSALSAPITGVDTLYSTLASIGLSTGEDGMMAFDQTVFGEAMENPENVIKIFGRIGDSTSTQVRLSDTSANTDAGDYYIDVTAAATRATVTGNQEIQSTGIASDENLTFTIGEDDETFTVSLTSGDTVSAIVEKLNERFATEGVKLEALNQNGKLVIQSEAYGSDAEFSVVSDAAGGTNTQTGIGTTLQEVTGTDVVGTINGKTATGSGQYLSQSNGLEVRVTSATPITATVTYTRGVADSLRDELAGYLGSDGIIEVRQDSIQESIDRQNDRIAAIEERIDRQAERLRNQFINMETQLAQWNSISTLLTNSLSTLNNSDSR